MKVKVIGKEYIEGVSKKTKEPYSATIAHVIYQKSNCLGTATESVWIDSRVSGYEGIELEHEYNADYNSKGFLTSFERAGK